MRWHTLTVAEHTQTFSGARRPVDVRRRMPTYVDALQRVSNVRITTAQRIRRMPSVFAEVFHTLLVRWRNRQGVTDIKAVFNFIRVVLWSSRQIHTL